MQKKQQQQPLRQQQQQQQQQQTNVQFSKKKKYDQIRHSLPPKIENIRPYVASSDSIKSIMSELVRWLGSNVQTGQKERNSFKLCSQCEMSHNGELTFYNIQHHLYLGTTKPGERDSVRLQWNLEINYHKFLDHAKNTFYQKQLNRATRLLKWLSSEHPAI